MLRLKDWVLLKNLKETGRSFSSVKPIFPELATWEDYPEYKAEGDTYHLTEEDEFSGVFQNAAHLEPLNTLYYQLMHRTWTDNEITFRNDRKDFEALNPDEKKYVLMNTAFFAFADGIVLDIINFGDAMFFKNRLVSGYLAQQAANEVVHERTYTKILEAIVEDPEERRKLFTDVSHFKSVGLKITWAKKWIGEATDLRVSILGRTITEAVQFSSAFASMFWLKSKVGADGKSVMEGTTLANDFIFEDESIHRNGGIALLKLFTKLPQSVVHEMIRSAVETEAEFVKECLPVPLERVSAETMTRFVEYVADLLLSDLGYEKLYNSKNPLIFMDMAGAAVKVLFFERQATYLSGRGALTHSSDIDPALDIYLFEKIIK